MSVPKIVEIIVSFPRDDCARNMLEEKSTTHQGLVCTEILLLHELSPSPQSNNRA